MSKSLSKHSAMRKSGNSIVVTVPAEIVAELKLKDGDNVFWSVEPWGLALQIIKLLNIAPDGYLSKRGDQEEEAEKAEETSIQNQDVVQVEVLAEEGEEEAH